MIYCLYGRVTSWVVLPISPRRVPLISNGVLSWVWGVPRGINVRNKRKCLLIPVDSWCRRRRVPRVCRICYLLRVNLHLPFQDLTGNATSHPKVSTRLGRRHDANINSSSKNFNDSRARPASRLGLFFPKPGKDAWNKI